MESASADDVRARGSPKGLVLAPLQAQAQHYPKGEGWKRSQFGSRKRSQTDRQTDAPTTTTLIASGPPLRGDPYFVCISTTLLRNYVHCMLLCLHCHTHTQPSTSKYLVVIECHVIVGMNSTNPRPRIPGSITWYWPQRANDRVLDRSIHAAMRSTIRRHRARHSLFFFFFFFFFFLLENTYSTRIV